MDNIGNRVFDRLCMRTSLHIDHFLKYFSSRVTTNEASLFLGAGISRNSGLPGWGTIIEPCAQELGIALTNESDLLEIAQYYANKHSDAELRRLVTCLLNTQAPRNKLLDELLNIEFHNIWTTNYDRLIERTLDYRQVNYNVVTNDRHLASIEQHGRVNIFKINGDVSEPATIVLTQRDIERYEVNHSLFLTFLKKELVSHTFLFAGYSFSDQIILKCLSSIKEFLGEAAGLHYALMLIDESVDPRFEYFVDDLERRYGIICLTVPKDELLTLVKRLNKQIRSKKVFISGAYAKVSSKTDMFADSVASALTHSLLDSGYRISTGVGKRLGTYVTGYGYQYLAEKHIQDPSRILTMRPFPFHLALDESKKKEYRYNMMHDCSSAIFLFGQSSYNLEHHIFEKEGHHSNGVYQEFQIAKELGLAVIPVGATGYEAEVIWREVKGEINKYYYLSKRIDLLYHEKRPNELARLIISILDDIAEYSNI